MTRPAPASPSAPLPDPVAAAAALGPAIAAAAAQTERRRRISPELLGALRDMGLFRMGLPREVGGHATDLPTLMAVYEEFGRWDGSTAWVAMIGSGNNLLMTGLPEATVREVFADPDVATGGLLAPRGRAVPVEGGYRVSGRWPFGSGCEHCAWMIGGALVWGDDGPALDDDGNPTYRVVAFPQSAATIHDTWHVAGLRGTGSHDYEVRDLFVPREHSYDLFADRPAFDFPHGRVPMLGLLSILLSSVPLGMARGALDALTEHATTTRYRGRLVADNPLLRARLAEAEGIVQAARAFSFSTMERVWELATTGAPISARDEALMRLAGSHAARACSEAIHLAFTAGGTAALYEDHPLQRFQRDILAAQQHGAVAYYSFEAVGGALLDAARGTTAAS